MNNFGTKAEIVLNHGHFQVKTPGDFVECSITGEKITLESLKYWNVELQEVYASPEVALKRYKELNGLSK